MAVEPCDCEGHDQSRRVRAQEWKRGGGSFSFELQCYQDFAQLEADKA